MGIKPGTHNASNHASCLVNGDARRISNICTCKRRLYQLTCMEHAIVREEVEKFQLC